MQLCKNAANNAVNGTVRSRSAKIMNSFDFKLSEDLAQLISVVNLVKPNSSLPFHGTRFVHSSRHDKNLYLAQKGLNQSHLNKLR